jgi:hypothetical protein
MTPGSSIIDRFQSSDVDIGLRRDLSGSALPKSRNPLHAGKSYEASLVSFATACQIARPPVRIRLEHPATGGFYIQAFNGLVSPLLDMTSTATGLLCWRDLHPLEWQLASLHQIRT